jgi:hypothetical protein
VRSAVVAGCGLLLRVYLCWLILKVCKMLLSKLNRIHLPLKQSRMENFVNEALHWFRISSYAAGTLQEPIP